MNTKKSVSIRAGSFCAVAVGAALLWVSSVAAPQAARPGESRPPESATPGRLEPGAAHAWLEINPQAFEENIRALQAELAGKAKLCAVLKADAYGHGIALLAPSVIALDVPCVGIASNAEARAMRVAGFTKELLRLRTATAGEMEAGLSDDIEECAGNLLLARTLSALALSHGKIVRIHLALNSGGMSRNGLEMKTEEGRRDALEITRLPGLKVVGIMSHFPVKDRQDVIRGLQVFKDESAWIIEYAKLNRNELTLHCANSFASHEVPDSRLDMVRCGRAIYGWDSTKAPPVMQFKSRVATILKFPAGNTVSYDRTFTLKRDSALANIPVGYSDGYQRAFSGKTSVLIGGKRLPVLGRITMNTIMVDVTDAPAIRPGDEVILFGRQGSEEITRAELEKAAGTIFAEMATMWGANNPRILGQ